ncbi:MAG: nucleotidyltransferase domain-containing protein [Candidatus Bathyarchaeia archaeon]
MVKRAVKRREAFESLGKYLRVIKEIVNKLDRHAEVFLFGSVAENRYTYSSDVDVLIVTKLDPAKVHFKLWSSGIKEPFEIHVQPPENANLYMRRGKLIKV